MAKKDYTQEIEGLLAKMTVEEKVAQLSCTTGALIVRDEEIVDELLEEWEGVGLGRLTQFATPFYSSPKKVAEAYNKVQKFLVEKTRLGIPAMIQMEAIAGALVTKGTGFPSPLSISATWDPELNEEVAEISKDECLAIGPKTILGPVMDIARDPRWGRIIETYGEDVYLASQFSKAYVHGLQGDNYADNAIACAKHFAGFAVSEGALHSGYVNMGDQELFEVYCTPFAATIKDNDLQDVMVTYAELNNNLPATVNRKLLQDMLVDQMEFKGSILCDGTSVERVYDLAGVGESMAEVAKRSLEVGIDTDSPVTVAYKELPEMVKNGEVDVKYLDDAVRRVLKQKFEMGLFENPYVDVDAVEEIYGRDHSELIKRLVDESIIMLENKNDILPLANKDQKIAVIGPHADCLRSFYYGYSFESHIEMIMSVANNEETGMVGLSSMYSKFMDKDEIRRSLHMNDYDPPEVQIETYLRNETDCVSLYEALKGELDKSDVRTTPGSGVKDGTEEQLAEAVALAKDSDVIVMALGEFNGWTKNGLSGEGGSRTMVDIPEPQEKLLEAVCELGKPVILVLFSGRPLAIPYAAEHCDAILHVWINGEKGASAIAETISGKNNPGGKLTLSFPRSVGQTPLYYAHKQGSGYLARSVDLMDKRPNPGVIGHLPYHIANRTFVGAYNDVEMAPLYPFGYGMSYSTFELSNCTCDESVMPKEAFKVAVDVQNTSDIAGSEVVQVYVHDEHASVVRPIRQMMGFKKVHLEAGEKVRVEFEIDTRQLGFFNVDDEFVIEPGWVRVDVGTSSADIDFQKRLEIQGETTEILHDRKFSCDVNVTKVD